MKSNRILGLNLNQTTTTHLYKLGLLASIVGSFSNALAAPQQRPVQRRTASDPVITTQTATKAQQVDVNGLKERYWELPQNDSSPMKVIQNRMYSKGGKFSLILNGGSFAGDPFLTQWTYGGGIGLNLSEAVGVHAIYTKFTNSFNSSYTNLITATKANGAAGVGSNSNEPQSLVGGELSYSAFYGKLSLGGFAIIHFDMMFLAGAGQMSINTGATSGIQQFTTTAFWPGFSLLTYLTTWSALRLDYKMLIYSQSIVDRNTAATMGTLITTQTAIAPEFQLGINFML